MRKRLLLRPALWALVLLAATAAWHLRPLARTTLYPVPFANGKYGYVNADGRVVIAAEWDVGYSFGADGYAVVAKSEHLAFTFVFIDRNGNLVDPLGEGFEDADVFLHRGGHDWNWGKHQGEVTNTGQIVANNEERFTPLRQAKPTKWGLARHGKTIIEPVWDDIQPFGAFDLAPVKVGKKWGYIDSEGRLVIKPKWDYVGVFAKNGLAAVSIGKYARRTTGTNPVPLNPDDCNSGFINRNGGVVIPLTWEGVWDFDDGGLAIVQSNGQFGAIDSTGALVIPAEWDTFYPFDAHGLAQVSKGKYWGLIDRSGTVIIPLEWEGISTFDDVESIQADDYDIFANCGRKQFRPEYRSVIRPDRSGLAHVLHNGKHGFIDRKGNILISLEWDSLDRFDANGFARVQRSGKWGFFNRAGRVAIPLEWDDACNFDKHGMALVVKNEKRGFIDLTGKTVVPLEWDRATEFNFDGMAIVSKVKKFGAINRAGELVIPLDWDEIFEFKKGIAKVTKGGLCGFINRNGEIQVPPEWDEVDPLRYQKPMLNWILPRIDPYTPDLIEARREGKQGIIDWSGNIIIAPEWTHIDIRSDAEAKSAAFVVSRSIDDDAGWLKDARVWLFKVLGREEARDQLCHLYDTQGRLIWSSDWLSEAFWIWAVTLAASIVVLADGVALWRRKRQVAGTS